MTKGQVYCPQSGASIAALLVVTSIIAIVALAGSQLIVNANRANRSTDRLQNLENLKQIVRTSLSCERTLGVTGWSLTPTSCVTTSYVLKTDAGNDLVDPSQDWALSARCVDNALVVDAVSTKPEPMLKKIIEKRDIFNGTSLLCRKFFVPGESCPIGTNLGEVVDKVPLCLIGTDKPAGFFLRKSNASTDGQPCIISNEFSQACACPAGSRIDRVTSTSTFNQWHRTTFCVWN